MMDLSNLREYEIIISLLGTALTFLITTIMLSKKFIKNKKARRIIEEVERVSNTLMSFVVQAEMFNNFTGEEKKEFVITKANQFAIENNISFNQEIISQKIEELIKLSRKVNSKTESEINYKKEEKDILLEIIKNLKGEEK